MMRTFEECVRASEKILMEGALGERLKREFERPFDPHVVMARLVEQERGRMALKAIWHEYIDIEYGLPFIATTPTRRADHDRMKAAGCDAVLLRH